MLATDFLISSYADLMYGTAHHRAQAAVPSPQSHIVFALCRLRAVARSTSLILFLDSDTLLTLR